jgi:diguanylate cyclase (GGDEF)-like protein
MPLNVFDEQLRKTPANPFDDIVGEMKQARTGAVSVAVEDAAKKNPDQQAEYIRMADQLRVPLSVIERNPDAYKGAAALHQNDFDSLLRDTPRLAQHLTEKPEFAAVAHDDLPALGGMEKALSVAENAVRELGAGTYRGATSGLFGMIEGAAARAMDAADQPTTARSIATSALELQGPQLFGQMAGRQRASAIQQWAQAHRQAAQATVETIKGPQTGAARFERGIYSGIESVGLMAPGLLTAVATKNPSVALAIMGGQTTGEAYGQAADQGVSATKAGIFATIQGAIEVGTEALPLQWLIKDLGAGSGFLKTLAHQVFSENIGEQAATALQDLAEWKFLPENQNKGWWDYAAARPGAALDTLVATVASVGATTGIATGAHRLVTGLGQAATSSKTQKRSPEAVESFVAQATKDSPAKAVYAPVDTWTTYWQSKGEDPAAMAASLTGDPQAYQKAVELGTDLEIPIAKYAAKLAGTEHNAFFANELKLDPAEMNAREATAHVEQLRQQQEAAQPTEPAQPSTLDQATDLMTQRMTEQGIPADTAQTYGAIWRAGIGTLASNFGIDPLALQSQYGPQGGPTITRQGMEPAPTPTPAPVPAEAPPDGTPEGVPVEAPTPEPQTPDTILQLRQQLSASQAERRATERSADIDPLTGLGNGRALSKALPAAEADPNTSVLFFDANNFGQINKATGSHEAGDAKLQQMAAALRQAATEAGIGDRVFRRAEGGDEFVILAPRDVAAQVRQRAEALFGAHQYVDKQGQPFEVSLTGTEGATVADAEGALQAAKAARKSPLGPQNAQGEAALFIGKQETGTDEPAIPLYRVQGGPHDGTTVTQDELRQWGIPIPQMGQTQTVLNQGAQQETPAFKAWFGDSKVVDENGDPLVVYHGTTSDVEAFDPSQRSAKTGNVTTQLGFFFTDSPAEANRYAEVWGRQGGNVMPVYLSLQNPYEMSYSEFDKLATAAFRSIVNEPGYDPAAVVRFGDMEGQHAAAERIARHEVVASEAVRARREELIAEGYDGVVVRMGRQHREFIAFEPNQIKSATGNQGTFDATGNILKQEQRGEIRFGTDRQFNITLLERADLSTFLHETGHFFLEVFGDLTDQLAQREGATFTPEQQRLQTDHAALLQWLGVESRAQIGREQHEQFARGFEAYLMEGKAPSLELRSAFARARAWLLGIYRSLRNLNVTLTPKVRGIFDRLLASDAAIQQAQQTASVSGMFLNAESAGMTDTQFAGYRGDIEDASRKAKEELDRQILAEVQREQTATWKAQRDAIKEQVTTEVQQQPVYRALAAMQKGTHPNGEPLIDGETTDPLKLSKTIISERYGAERLKSLPKPYIYSREGGLDPDTVAEMFGFSSGDALLTAVSTAPSMRSVIERETAGRMFQQHGSLLLDGTLGEKAQAAVANDSREEVIRKELKALHQLQRKGAATLKATIPSMTAIRNAAREQIARTRYGDIKPQLYWAAGLRAGRQAMELAAQQKFPEAVAAKQQQLYNLALYREAIAQRTDMDRRVAAARELDSPKSRARIGLAGGTFQYQIDGILDQYEFARVSQKALDRRASLRKWVAALEGEGLPVDLPDELLEQTRRINYRDLTVEQLIGVTDGLKQIVHLARLKNKLLKSQAARDFGAVRDDVSASIYEHGTVRPRQLEIGQREQAWRSVSDWYASHVKLADLAQSMDGGQEGGPMWEAFVRPLNVAADAEETRSREAGKAYAALLEQYYPGRELGRLSEKREIRAINGSLSKEAILALAQNQGTESNKARLLTDSYRNFTEPQIRAILDTLDQRDWEFVQAHFDYLETYWPEIAAKMKRVTGVEPEKVPATPIVTKFGTYRGGYHPLVADTRLSPAAAQHDLATQAKLGESAAYLRTTTRRGHEQARVEHADYPVRLELGVTFKHLSQVIHDLTHHEMLIDTTRLLRDPKVRQAIVETQGDIVYSKFSRWLQDIALGDTSGGGKPTIADKAATFMRTRTQVMAMAYNLWTAMQQPLGIFNGMSRVGGTDGASSGVYWVSKGMSRWLRDAGSMENTVAWIRDASPMMAGRFGNETGTQDLRDLRASFSQSGGWFDSLLRTVTLDHLTQQALMNSFLWHIGMAQRVADVPTWLGMYEKQMAKGETEDRAIALADQAVIDSQGGGQVKDLAEIQRGGPVAKLFMSFASYGVTVLNANARATRQTNFRSASSALSFLGHLTLLNVMPALGIVAMRQALFGGRGGDDDESWATWIEAAGAEMLSSSLNGIIFVRELSGAAQLALGLDTTGGRGYGGPAGMRAMKLTYDLATQIHQGEADAAAGKAALGMTGFLLKFPSTQIQKTVDGWVALEEGRTSNPVALVVGPPPKGQ